MLVGARGRHDVISALVAGAIALASCTDDGSTEVAPGSAGGSTAGEPASGSTAGESAGGSVGAAGSPNGGSIGDDVCPSSASFENATLARAEAPPGMFS